MENDLEEFQRLAGFPRKMVLYSSTKFGILNLLTIVSNLIRFDLGFCQPSKQIHRKLEYSKKVLEEFQRLLCFPRKMVLYSSTKLGILKTLTIVSNLLKFDLGFWQPSKQIYRKLEYSEKDLEEFQRLLRFPRKMVLYSSTKFGILKSWTIISILIRFALGFWQASTLFYKKFKYMENDLEEFQRLLRFSRKMVLYSSTKFGILKPWTFFFSLIRFDLGFWQASKQIYRKFEYRKRFWKSFNVCLAFPEKWFCIRQPIFAF